MKFYQYVCLFVMVIFSCSVTHANDIALMFSGVTPCCKEGEMCFVSRDMTQIQEIADEYYFIGKTKKDQADGLYKCQIAKKDTSIERTFFGDYYWLKCDLNDLEHFCTNQVVSMEFTDEALFLKMENAVVPTSQVSGYIFTAKQLSNDRWKVTERHTKLSFFYEKGEDKAVDDGLEGQPMHNKAEDAE